MLTFLLMLFRRRRLRAFRVGDLVSHRGRAMAVSRIDGDRAEVIWLDENRQLHTAGFVPMQRLTALGREG